MLFKGSRSTNAVTDINKSRLGWNPLTIWTSPSWDFGTHAAMSWSITDFKKWLGLSLNSILFPNVGIGVPFRRFLYFLQSLSGFKCWAPFHRFSDPHNVPSIVQFLISNSKAIVEGESESKYVHFYLEYRIRWREMYLVLVRGWTHFSNLCLGHLWLPYQTD